MTEISRPFTGTSPGDAGPYSAANWARVWKTVFSGTNRADASVIWGTGSSQLARPLEVTQTTPVSSAIEIQIGVALVNGYWYEQDAAGGLKQITPIPNNDASGDDRIDRVVLELNIADQRVRLTLLPGTVAPVPVPPALTQTAAVWQVPLAQVVVTNGVTNRTTSEITQESVPMALMPYQHGGTGLSSYAVRQLLVGQSDGSIALEYLTGFLVERLTAMGGLASGAWQTLTLDADSAAKDPDGLITISGNQITFLEAGFYKARATFVGTLNAGTAVVRHRIRDITNTETLATFNGMNLSAAIPRQPSLIPNKFIIPAANTVCEIQSYHSANTLTYAPDTLPADGETFYAMRVYFERMSN